MADLIPDIVDMLIQIPLLSLGIVVLFFTYGTQVQKQVIANQLKSAAAYCMHPMSVLLPDEAKQMVKKYLQLPSNSAAEDAKVEANNKILEEQVLVWLTGLIILFTIIITLILLIYRHPFPWGSLFDAITITGCVMLVEFMFVTIISGKYMVVDVQKMYATFMSKISVQ